MERDSLDQGLKRAYQGRTFTDTQEEVRTDALPAATNDSCGYQREMNPRLLGARPSH